MGRRRRDGRRGGIALLWIIVLFTMLVGFASLGVDWGRVQLAKTQLQVAADAAVRAACAGFPAGVSTAQNMAVQYAADNTVDGTAVTIDPNNDVEFGTWDPNAKTFTVLTGSARASANAIRVSARRTAANGNPIKLTFASLIGMSSCDVNASAIALPASGYGIVGLSSISMSGNSSDSYASSTSTDPTVSPTHNGTVACNGNISLSGGSTIQGDAHPGIGKSVSTSGGSTVSGSSSPLTTTLSYPNATAGSYATNNDDGNVPGQYLNGSNDFNIAGGNTLALPGGNYYFHNFNVQGGSALSFTGSATLWITGTTSISDRFTTYASRPANLTINMCSASNFTESINSAYTIFANVYAPQSQVKISNGNLAGAVICNSLVMSGSSMIYFDESLPTYGTSIRLAK